MGVRGFDASSACASTLFEELKAHGTAIELASESRIAHPEARLVGLRERGRKLERKKAASYLLASHLILSTSIFIRLELSMEDHVYTECLKSSKV